MVDELEDPSHATVWTPAARELVSRAGQESFDLLIDYLDAAQILLAIGRSPKSRAARLLCRMGVDPAVIRGEILGDIDPADRLSEPTRDQVVTPRLRRVLEAAAEEAERLGHESVGPEHIVLGLMNEDAGPIAQLLEKHGARMEVARAEVMSIRRGGRAQ